MLRERLGSGLGITFHRYRRQAITAWQLDVFWHLWQFLILGFCQRSRGTSSTIRMPELQICDAASVSRHIRIDFLAPQIDAARQILDLGEAHLFQR